MGAERVLGRTSTPTPALPRQGGGSEATLRMSSARAHLPFELTALARWVKNSIYTCIRPGIITPLVRCNYARTK